MQFEGMRRGAQIPNLTPLIDIVFLLLVFFLLTAHFVKDKRLDIQLPKAESALPSDKDAALELVLDRQNHIHIGDKLIRDGDLTTAVEQALRMRSNKQITLRGDQGADLKHVVAVMDAAHKAGASGVDIVTDQP